MRFKTLLHEERKHRLRVTKVLQHIERNDVRKAVFSSIPDQCSERAAEVSVEIDTLHPFAVGPGVGERVGVNVDPPYPGTLEL